MLEMVLPVYGGQIRLLALSKQRGLGLLIILDTVIIFEFSSEALSYREAAGFENGLIVSYYVNHKPQSVVTFAFEEANFTLYLADS